MKVRSLALVAIVALAACSGGAGNGSSPLPGGGGGVAPTATPAPPAPGPTGATASITIRIPLAAHSGSSGVRPAYVSPSTSTLRVQINTVNGGTPPAWVPTDVSTALVVGTNCSISGGTEICTVPVAAPVGLVNYTFTAGDGTNALSTVTADQTNAQGTNNSFNVTLKGIVAAVIVNANQLVANAPPSGGSEIATVIVTDADGNDIVDPGNYNNPVTLTDNDPTGATALSVNGGSTGSSVVLNSPDDVVHLAYAGRAANDFTIESTATGVDSISTIGVTANDVTFTGATLDDAAHGGLPADPNWGQQTVFFAQPTGTANFTAAELGFTNAPYSQAFDVTLSSGANSCAGIASISAGPATTFTVTPLGVGICSGQVTEHGTGYPITSHPASTSGNPTQDGHFWISVTSSSFGINHSGATKF